MAFKLGGLFLEFNARTDAFYAALDAAEEAARATAEAVGQSTDFSFGGGGGLGLSQAAGDVGMLGAQIRAGMQSALLPITRMGAQMGQLFDRLAGTVVTMARRIDAAMKLQAANQAVNGLSEALKSRLANAAGTAAGQLTITQRALLALGPSALRTLATFKGFENVKGYLSSIGDVAKKSASQMKGMAFPPTAMRSPGQLATGIKSIDRAANASIGTFRRLGAEIALALGAFSLVFKAVQFIKGGIAEASHLAETMNKTKEVFGDAMPVVKGLADQMSKSFGYTKRSILDAASGFGLFFQEAGKNNKEAADMSNRLVKLAADFTSFSDIPFDVMLDKLKSGLEGEARPLRDVGIFLDDAAVEAEALARGFAKSKGAIDDQAKILARYSLILKSTAAAKATGDLERTADSVANQFRKTGGGLKNFGEMIGEVLLPAVSSATTAFNELLASIIEAFESNRGLIEEWAGNLTDAFDTVGVVIRNWPAVWEIVSLTVQEKLINILEYIETLPQNLGIVADYIAGNWKELIIDAINAVAVAFQNWNNNLRDFGQALIDFLRDPTQGFNFQWTPLLDGFSAAAAEFPELVKPHLTSLQDEIAKAGDKIAENERSRLEGMKKSITRSGVPKGEKAKKAGKEEKSEESSFAEFASKLRAKQFEERDKAMNDNTKAVERNTEAGNKLEEALKLASKGAAAVFAE